MQKKDSNDNCNFFDDNIDFYGEVKPTSCDVYFLNFIKKSQKQNANLLDIGGGSGTFAKLVKDNCSDIEVTVIDPSKKLLGKIDDDRIIKLQGALPTQISLNKNFDYIHVKEVLHHLAGSSVKASKELLKESLLTIKAHLNNNGFILIHELFYESYVIPAFSRNFIFYLLVVQNKLRIKLPVSRFLMDLNVCFYTRSEFQTMLQDCGFRIVEKREEYWKDNWQKRAVLLKHWGRMMFILDIAP
jgi:cyclopropane fatty-acyl-phospholipid synthase-like methyltransferase